MNKTAINNFAVWARNKLIADVRFQARMAGVMEDGIAEPLPQSDRRAQFFNIGTRDYATVRGDDITRREALAYEIREKALRSDYESAYRAVTEKVAYTWFNRLIAIRFMEVNDYLPGRVRVLSSRFEGKAEPDIVSEPFESDLFFTDGEREQIQRMKDENRLDELFRLLFIRECEALSGILPGLFENRDDAWSKRDYYNLLLSINFTDRDGIVWHLVHDIPESDFRVRTAEDELRQRAEGIPEEAMPAGQVNIIGWLYQYYNTEPKDRVFANLKKNKKIEAEDIPAATQLFTPDWIVRYMVENSLGRLWLEGRPNDALKSNWRYYLDEAEQEPEVQTKLDELRAGYAKLRPEEIKVIDPCCGSGHIAVYMFDVLMQIYESQGWTRRDAVCSILENNLYALDIDDRAAQLAYFAVMMKAREYDRRFLTRTDEGGHPDIPQPKVYGIIESTTMPENAWDYFGPEKELAQYIYAQFAEAKTLGSAIQVNVSAEQLAALRARLEEMDRMADYGSLSVQAMVGTAFSVMWPLMEQAEIFTQKYDAVVTNPPYMGSNGMGATLSKFVKDNYPDSKADLFAVFIERCAQFAKAGGYQAMITQHAWMFLSSFEKLRGKLMALDTVNMAHLGARAFEEISGEVVQTTSFVLRKCHTPGFRGTYARLVEPTTQQGKEDMFLSGENRYVASQDNFTKIPGAPVAYWVSDALFNSFLFPRLKEYGEAKQGLITGSNEIFLRLWYEVEVRSIEFSALNRRAASISGKKWFPYNKGGEYRKWYGNNEYVVLWESDGERIRTFTDEKGKLRSRPQNLDCYFLEGFSWSDITSGSFSARYAQAGFIHDSTGPKFFTNGRVSLLYLVGAINSKPIIEQLKLLAPTFHFREGPVSSTTLPESEHSQRVASIVEECIVFSRADWDSFETSWDFQEHPLVRWSKEIWDATSIACTMSNYYGHRPEFHSPLEECFLLWQGECLDRFNKLKANEEELNRIFIDIYGLQDELTPEVEDRDVTVRRADLGRDIRSLISYAVGCMFGRYSLDTPGLAYAGGEWDADKYRSFQPDPDNCIPITDEAYFEDDIVGRLEEFLRVVYGRETLEQNLDFIASALGNRGSTSREIIRNYFLNDFYKDHLKTYQKRPIYWLFDSGRQNGFKALVYMHRWNADTAGNVRADYLHRMQRVYEREIERMKNAADNSPDSREAARAAKRAEKLTKQLREAREYDARLAHAALTRPTIDLDDGVKVNHAKVQQGPDGESLEILAKIN